MAEISDVELLKVVLIVCVVLTLVLLLFVVIIFGLAYRSWGRSKWYKNQQKDQTIENLQRRLERKKSTQLYNLYSPAPGGMHIPVHYKPQYASTAYPALPMINEEDTVPVAPPAGSFDVKHVKKKGYTQPAALFYVDHTAALKKSRRK